MRRTARLSEWFIVSLTKNFLYEIWGSRGIDREVAIFLDWGRLERYYCTLTNEAAILMQSR